MVTRRATTIGGDGGDGVGGSAGDVGGASGGFHGNVNVIEGDIPRETGYYGFHGPPRSVCLGLQNQLRGGGREGGREGKAGYHGTH